MTYNKTCIWVKLMALCSPPCHAIALVRAVDRTMAVRYWIPSHRYIEDRMASCLQPMFPHRLHSISNVRHAMTRPMTALSSTATRTLSKQIVAISIVPALPALPFGQSASPCCDGGRRCENGRAFANFFRLVCTYVSRVCIIREGLLGFENLGSESE
jgi:hypothetical protein